jgi:choline dehydrogenase-like flavoprotein
MSDHYDLILIGTGAGGGTLLHRLAPSGKRILVLERGPFLAREKENWDTKIAFNTTRYFGPEVWYDKNGGEVRAGMWTRRGNSPAKASNAPGRRRRVRFQGVAQARAKAPRTFKGPACECSPHRSRSNPTPPVN